MAKMACAQCGGAKKMQVGGRSIPFPIIPRKEGPRKYLQSSMQEGEDGVWRNYGYNPEADKQNPEPTKPTKKTANKVKRQAAVNKVKKTVRKIGKALSPKYQGGGSTTTKMAKGGSSKSCPPGEHLVRGICTPKMLSSTGAKIGIGTVLAGAAGMVGSAIKKKVAANKTKKEETGTTMAQHRKMDRQDKRYMRKYEKQKAEELMKSKRFQTGGMTGIVGMPKYGNNPNTQEGRMLKHGGAFAPNRAVQASCKNGMVRDENGRCVMQRMMQTGGATKTTKAKRFAALAPPYNKATAADRIAGAKKNARKK